MSSALHPLLLVVGLSAVTALNRPAIADKLDAVSIPTGAVYVCAAGSGKNRTIAVIALEEKVAALCRRHTEMSPCQNARNACRRSGGRVYAAKQQQWKLFRILGADGTMVPGDSALAETIGGEDREPPH